MNDQIHSNKMPSQRDIAKNLGLNQSTVSLALRNSRLISTTIRQAVRREAERIGYRPNALVAALMAQVREGRPVKEGGTIAILVNHRDAEEWLWHPSYVRQYEGIRSQAKLRGQKIETYFLGTPEMSVRRVDSILAARGIHSVILPMQLATVGRRLPLSWENFSIVRAGYVWEQMPVDTVVPHFRHMFQTGVRKLMGLGYRRIGFQINPWVIHRADSEWIAGFHVMKAVLPPEEGVELDLFIGRSDTVSRQVFEDWLRRFQPEALISMGGEVFPWVEELGLVDGKSIGLVATHLTPLPGAAILDGNDIAAGRLLVDQLLELVIHNKRGFPEVPRLITIEGKWIDGPLCPRKSAPGDS